jgi:hypothetical protein
MKLYPIEVLIFFVCLLQVYVCAESTKSPSHLIPKKVWIYTSSTPSLFSELNLLNIKHLASFQNYFIHEVTQQTYELHLSP